MTRVSEDSRPSGRGGASGAADALSSPDSERAPVRVCVLGVGGGGFHFEVEYLTDRIDIPLELVLVYAIDSHVDRTWGGTKPVSAVFVVRSPAMRDDRWGRRVWSLSTAIWRALWILVSTRPDCILAVGTAQAVPFGIAGRLLGVPLYFVESITRVKHESFTARLVRRLALARWHRVQWESLASAPRTTFRGSLLQ